MFYLFTFITYIQNKYFAKNLHIEVIRFFFSIFILNCIVIILSYIQVFHKKKITSTDTLNLLITLFITIHSKIIMIRTVTMIIVIFYALKVKTKEIIDTLKVSKSTK